MGERRKKRLLNNISDFSLSKTARSMSRYKTDTMTVDLIRVDIHQCESTCKKVSCTPDKDI